MSETGELPAVKRKGAIILGGAHGSLEIARSLGRRGIAVWHVTADNPLASLSRYVERSLSWPGPRDGGALEFLIALARRCALDGWVVFPGSDEDLHFVAQNHNALGAVFTLVTPAWDKIRWAYDKRRMNARAAELGIAQPRTRYPQSRDDLSDLGMPFPVILKPTVREDRNAFVDAKAWRTDDQQALLARYDEAKALVGADGIMVQELIPGDGTAQFSYAAVWDRGRPIGALVARRRRQYPIDFGFTSTLVESIELPAIEAAAARFLDSLSFSGLVEIEFKYDARDGSYKILDVNARAWTWIGLGAAAGIDFAALQWRLAAGETVVPMAGKSGACWLYLSRDLAASLHEMLAGRLSPLTYLRSLRRSSAAAVFAWDDPWPAVIDLPLSAVRVAARRLTRRRASATLQSVKQPT
ncbi:MAG: ATP-grasp domain-containing protein [Xanthobacteraceae bacterium]|jgi:predicted ATP-grasp superfamily ATP-dependent carboligase